MLFLGVNAHAYGFFFFFFFNIFLRLLVSARSVFQVLLCFSISFAICHHLNLSHFVNLFLVLLEFLLNFVISNELE